MSDNLARVLREEQYEEYYRQVAERARRKARAKRAERIRSVICVAVAFVLAYAIVSRYMHINEQQKQIASLESNVTTLQSANDQKEVQIENSMTIDEIEEIATTRLGMNKPANNQIVYVSIPKEDSSYVASN